MNSRVWMIGLLLIMAVVCSTSLAVVNFKTAPIIQKNQEVTYKSTVLEVFGVPFDAGDDDAVLASFDRRIEEREAGGQTLFFDRESDATALFLEGSGFQGPISVVVALDGETITGFKVVSQVETPGLGARITEEDFQRSFVGKKVGGGIGMVKSGSAGESEFDAVTGATETSRALEKILDRGFKRYFEARKNI